MEKAGTKMEVMDSGKGEGPFSGSVHFSGTFYFFPDNPA